jgi:hypothetical protein
MGTMPSAAFEKAPREPMLRDGQLDLDALLLWIRAQVDVGWQDAAPDEVALAAIPEPARVLWLLVIFEGGVYNGGLASFLLQQSEWIIRGCLDALRAVGAQGLLATVESGIPIAAHSGAQFVGVRAKGGSWWRELQGDDDRSLSSLDERAGPLLDGELRARLGDYARRHQDELIA